ncbi:uncharacterized protein LOC106877540 [Octopus bimaculoides]|uniref:SEFIR domain-containing protein n=1 Tax=Octopus bimaculoides TaxID=37653 RepID=A0A0L8GDH3_OCTBM|nr:uncharacterized protein LOC106877540 [Octopus bimaculoides]|eukprot:XP_014781951.1 PREDICTED: uncharacterized protein LOC106877540 [Octopus bimaculoides]
MSCCDVHYAFKRIKCNNINNSNNNDDDDDDDDDNNNNGKNDNSSSSTNKIWTLKPHGWTLVVSLVLLLMAQLGSAGTCDNHHKRFSPYPCRQIKRTKEDLTFDCTVCIRPYCNNSKKQKKLQEFPESNLKLEGINIYDYEFNPEIYDSDLIPTLNLTISLPKGEALLHTNGVRLDIWSFANGSHYNYPGICRYLRFSNVQFKPDSKLALLNHNCFWISKNKVNITYFIKISLYPSTQEIVYDAKIIDEKTILATAAIFPLGTIHAILGISPTSKEFLKQFKLTNLDSLKNLTIYTTQNSVLFSNLDSGKYQITIHSSQINSKDGLLSAIIYIKRPPEKFPSLIILLSLLLLITITLLVICLLSRKHIKSMLVGQKTSGTVLLVTFHEDSHDEQLTHILKNVFEKNFKWIVDTVDAKEHSRLNNYPTFQEQAIFFIMPSHWKCDADSREMTAIFVFNSLSTNSSLPAAVIYQQAKTDIPKCLHKLPKFHIIEDIMKIFKHVYKTYDVHSKCLSLVKLIFSPVHQDQIYKCSTWKKLKESIEGLSDSECFCEDKATQGSTLLAPHTFQALFLE